MHGANVVTVRAILSGELPVALVGIGRGAPQDFQTVFRLIHDVVNDLGGFPQVFLKGHHIGIQAAEEEAAIVAKLRQLLEIMRAVSIELLWIATLLLILGF